MSALDLILKQTDLNQERDAEGNYIPFMVSLYTLPITLVNDLNISYSKPSLVIFPRKHVVVVVSF